MIEVVIWDDDGESYDAPTMSPKDIKDFVELIKEFGIWIGGEHYSFKEAMYDAEEKTFDINIELEEK